jgi:hypothetical protein
MPSASEISDCVLRGLADTRDESVSALRGQLKGGDLAIDSKEAECVIAFVEDELGVGELVSSADLEPEQMTSLRTLTQILVRRGAKAA